jgi:hypothetical protein
MDTDSDRQELDADPDSNRQALDEDPGYNTAFTIFKKKDHARDKSEMYFGIISESAMCDMRRSCPCSS